MPRHCANTCRRPRGSSARAAAPCAGTPGRPGFCPRWFDGGWELLILAQRFRDPCRKRRLRQVGNRKSGSTVSRSKQATTFRGHFRRTEPREDTKRFSRAECLGSLASALDSSNFGRARGLPDHERPISGFDSSRTVACTGDLRHVSAELRCPGQTASTARFWARPPVVRTREPLSPPALPSNSV